MDIPHPIEKGFTIYSKSGCPNCTTVKKLLKSHNFLFTEINCDEYLLEDKQQFLTFMEIIAETSYRTFPMIFYDKKFVGGSTHTNEFINKFLLSFEDKF